jgi:hypothetical protein
MIYSSEWGVCGAGPRSFASETLALQSEMLTARTAAGILVSAGSNRIEVCYRIRGSAVKCARPSLIVRGLHSISRVNAKWN